MKDLLGGSASALVDTANTLSMAAISRTPGTLAVTAAVIHG
jgi:hypothetical protein